MQFLLYAIFFASALLLILVILLQEPEGGGLGEAFGGAASETFGPRAGGVNKFTFALFAVWILSALGLHWTSEGASAGSVMGDNPAPPVVGTNQPPSPGNTSLPGDAGTGQPLVPTPPQQQ